jgi:hypothetical protein
MAYMSQEKKKQLAPAIKAILAKHGLKGTLGVLNHSTLTLKIMSGSLDFEGDYLGDRRFSECAGGFSVPVNTYHIDSGWKNQSRRALVELREAMMVGNHDRSDSMTDYFDVGWYIDIDIGLWNKPYVLN